ncbi:hypothetical protein TK78_01020 [Streptomyces sp. Tue 6075]|uniref:hypothetical protein n=1 Tax=Streptomyces sp. Tue 6075 TaxID=1661694 RepID=UPI00094A5820|nr:hypothetical protein [Streptomyces sp. Tue 6075]APS17667.1 hypothetical protein TK78_01020 [Streptomyces sp. Tue 6075]
MSRPLPKDEQIRTEMEAELGESRSLGRRATVSNVGKRLGVTHATFYRNYPDQIEWFTAQLVARREAAVTVNDMTKHEDDLDRLRRENTNQLSMDKAALEDKLQTLGRIASLDQHRRHRAEH